MSPSLTSGLKCPTAVVQREHSATINVDLLSRILPLVSTCAKRCLQISAWLLFVMVGLTPIPCLAQGHLTDLGRSAVSGQFRVVPRSAGRWFADVMVSGTYRGMIDASAAYVRSSLQRGGITGNGAAVGVTLHVIRLFGSSPVEGFVAASTQTDSYSTSDPTIDLSGSSRGFEFGAYRKVSIGRRSEQVLWGSFTRFRGYMELDGKGEHAWDNVWGVGTSFILNRSADHSLVLSMGGIFQSEDYQAISLAIGVLGRAR